MNLRQYPIPFLTGVALGFSLICTELHYPAAIRGNFSASKQGYDWTFFNTLLASSALCAVFIFDVNQSKIFLEHELEPRSASDYGWFRYDGNVIGGFLQGIGMVLCTADPGTMLIQASMGLRSGLWATLGGIIGGWVFVLYAGKLKTIKNTAQNPTTPAQISATKTGPATIQSTLRISPLSALLLYEGMLLSLLYGINQFESTTSKRGRFTFFSLIARGVSLFYAQLFSVLFAKKTIGVSSAFPDLARYLTHTVSKRDKQNTAHSFPSSVVFALGVASAVPLGLVLMEPASVFVLRSWLARLRSVHVPDTRTSTEALLGGALLIFGARVSGGCSSGHGLSGTSLMSVSSFITVACMMLGGFVMGWILDALLMGRLYKLISM